MDLATVLSIAVALVIAVSGYLLFDDELPRLRRSGPASKRRR